jgi:hypothetical protein
VRGLLAARCHHADIFRQQDDTHVTSRHDLRDNVHSGLHRRVWCRGTRITSSEQRMAKTLTPPKSNGTNGIRSSRVGTTTVDRTVDNKRRGSFAMPQHDYALLQDLKLKAASLERPTKKNELLRAGLRALTRLNNVTLVAALDALDPQRPPKRSTKSASVVKPPALVIPNRRPPPKRR